MTNKNKKTKTMKNIINLIIATVGLTSLQAQGDMRVSNGVINITGNAAVNVVGNVQYDNGTSSEIDGELYLNNNWINNSGGTALNSNSIGTVFLSGNAQDITGSDATTFYDLEFLNTGAIKTTLVNTFIKNSLNFNDAVLQTDAFLTHVTNPALNSVQWSGGYVESNNLAGYFLRSTNSTATYPFPVGNASLTDIYRPVELIPTSPDSSVFGVRLAASDPSFESGTSAAGAVAPFNVANKEASLANLNTNFYHNIHRFSGASNANARVFFFNSDQGTSQFSSMAKWNSSQSKWLNDNFSIQNSPARPLFNNTDKMAVSRNVLDYTDDVYTLNELDIVLITTFTPNGDGFNDVFKIPGLDRYPNNKLEVYNRWGELVYSASPYLNNWDGTNISNGVKLQTDLAQEDTYFYVLTLDEKTDPIKNFLEIIRD